MASIDVPPNCELFFPMGKRPATVSLTPSAAGLVKEGTPLQPNSASRFPVPFFIYNPTDVAVSVQTAFRGATLQPTSGYYTHLHAALLDHPALSRPSRVVIIGETDTGKSTLCTILANHISSKSRDLAPFFVDFDVGQNVFCPGCVTLIPPPSVGRERVVFWYGHNTPSANGGLYEFLFRRVARHLDEAGEESRMGCVVNTCGWIRGPGLKFIMNLSTIIDADLLVVIDSQRSADSLTHRFGAEKVVLLQKNPNVRRRNRTFRKNTRVAQIRDYFLDQPAAAVVNVGFDNVVLCRVGRAGGGGGGGGGGRRGGRRRGGGRGGRGANERFPVGSKKGSSETRVSVVSFEDEGLKDSVVGLSHASDLDEVLESNVMGLGYISAVDTRRRKLSVVCHCAAQSMPKFLVLGSINHG